MPSQVAITFKGANLATSTMRLENLSSTITETQVDAFKTSLATYHDTQVSSDNILAKRYFSVSGAGNTDKKAIIAAQDSNGHVHKWMIPGYTGATETDEKGEKVEAAALTAILAAIATITGLTLSPLRSGVIQTL